MSVSLGKVRKYSLVPYLDRCPEYHGTYKVYSSEVSLQNYVSFVGLMYSRQLRARDSLTKEKKREIEDAENENLSKVAILSRPSSILSSIVLRGNSRECA
ncbi:hypothetical protein PUN28_015833 [Cardiocondyla obscurior]|uniref:Uncharacterized protein n=1 Tax=Cardiocondyla obscurior TaxID=286306 RepID=A0AAW2EUQ1_9HYME